MERKIDNMKYARMIYGRNEKQMQSVQYVNIGDYFQTFAIDNIYHNMGIDTADVCSIDKSKIGTWSGEELELPMQGWFGHIKGYDIFPIPSSITPVFIGYHSVSRHNYGREQINCYKKFGPIGCRDEGTYKRMCQKGVLAYLTGDLTLTLPTREKEPQTTHVFLVDAPKGIEEYMPDKLKKGMTYITHEVAINSENSDVQEVERIERLSRDLLYRYKEEATLIVTSRLHCAAPCMGMGIPVILARNYFDERYAWIDKYVPLYTPERFCSIDWYPEKVDLSIIKPLLTEMAKQTIVKGMAQRN